MGTVLSPKGLTVTPNEDQSATETMETALTSCTECGAAVHGNQELCPRCHRPRWYTLKKISACLLIIFILMALIKYLAVYGDRTLSMWFG